MSTFAIDVDTAAYALVRRALNEGRLPAARTIRAEEMLNCFRYAYAPPPPVDANLFAIEADGAVSPVDPTEHILRIGIQARRPARADPMTAPRYAKGSMGRRSSVLVVWWCW